MSEVERAASVLAAAAARHPGILVPGDVTSPMDVCATVTIPAAVISGCEPAPRAELLDHEMEQIAAGLRPAPLRRRA